METHTTQTSGSLPRLVRRDGRYEWLMRYILSKGQVDVLNSDFVDEYIASTHAPHTPTAWGAYKCPTLGKDLTHMAKVGALKRGRIGLSGNWQPGFPKWVWAYSAGHAAYLYAPNVLAHTRAGTQESAETTDTQTKNEL